MANLPIVSAPQIKSAATSLAKSQLSKIELPKVELPKIKAPNLADAKKKVAEKVQSVEDKAKSLIPKVEPRQAGASGITSGVKKQFFSAVQSKFKSLL